MPYTFPIPRRCLSARKSSAAGIDSGVGSVDEVAERIRSVSLLTNCQPVSVHEETECMAVVRNAVS